MQTTQSDYFSAYRSLKLTRGSNGVLVAEFHSNGGPLTFTAPDHTRLSDRLCVDVVALVGLHVRLHILRWGSTAPHDPALAVPGPRKCGPPHASMPIKWTRRLAVKCRSWLRENFLRTTTSPHRLSPTR